MKQILPAAKSYLENNHRIKTAGLLRLELPQSSIQNPLYIYLTDYFRDVVYKGVLYKAGKLKSISSHKQDRTLTVGSINFTITGTDDEEILRLVSEGVSFIDRKVTIHQAIIDSSGEVLPVDPDTNGALIFFQGRITGGGVKEDIDPTGEGSSTITWQAANQFYDFERVNGRITDDPSHRGLEVINGQLTPGSGAKRPEYQDDYGFFHANKSINILAKYQTKELRYKLESKKKFFGLSKKYNLVEYYETVTKEVDMDFNLTAKYLPVVYGVQKVPGIPVFADTEKNNPNVVWLVYAFCEGEIEGFLDFRFGEVPMICYDNLDSKDRTCFGAKKVVGDTMHRLATGSPTSAPSTHGQEYKYNDGNGDIRIWTFHGKKDQTAAEVLVNVAKDKGFYLQDQANQGPEYWDERYKLLDTAYAVVRFTITENRTNIPSVEAEIQGRMVNIYNEQGLVSTNKTTLNGAWQAYDYLTSSIFGAGLPLDEVSLRHFREVAEVLDIQDTTYEASWVPYWRYIGWDNSSQSNRAIIQLNTILDTAESVFKVTQGLLDHFQGALNNLAGQYTLTVEKYASPVLDLTFMDTTGDISLDDTTGKDKYNSVQATLIEPGFAWKSNAITFFNSKYKAQDKNLEKKMQLSFAYITNYYCARSMAERELKKSRYSRYFSFTLPYKFLGLEPNDPVTFTLPRYGWNKKFFLVDSVENTRDGKLEVVLKEYDKDVFINSEQKDNSGNEIPPVTNNVLPPRDFKFTPTPATSEEGLIGKNGELSWLPSLTVDVVYYTIHQTDKIDPYIIQVSGSGTPNDRLKQELHKLPKGLYVFEIRAVDVNGRRSSPVTISVNMDNAKNLSIVPNFVVRNLVSGDTQEWGGPDLLLAWDPVPEEKLFSGLYYTLEIMNVAGTTLRSIRLDRTYKYDYVLLFNKADYAALNSGALGINRGLNARIRAEGQNGERSVDWAYI